jgi:PAS domain S-box-containing protein
LPPACRMLPSKSQTTLSARVPARQATAPCAVERRSPFVVAGRWAFILSMVAGVTVGLAIIPVAANRIDAALLTLGAFCIVATTARRANRAEIEAEELRQKLLDERSYHAFVDSAVEGFFRTTRDGRYLIVNPALANIYGYNSPAQLAGELTDIGASLYVDPNRRKEFQALMAANRAVQNFVSQIRRRDGTVIWISENARTVSDEDDQFLFYEGTVQDITAQIDSEFAMRRALQETQEAVRAKAAFLAAMSHELKTPLNAVIGFSDLMLQDMFGPVEPPRYREYISDIHDNGRRLLALINDILDLSRIEGRLIALQSHAVFLPDVVKAARDAAIEGKSNVAPVAIDVPSDLPLVRADTQRLRQTLAHLISNAVKFTPAEGSIGLRAWLDAEGGVTIAISDTGIGMAPEHIQHALEPFKQLDSSLSRRFEGAGLGLPLASALMRLHGGRLVIESTLGKGTTVTVRFPPDRTIELAPAEAG